MINVTMSRQGTVGLEVNTRSSMLRLLDLPYVRVRRNSRKGATWWTYLGDLRRDLPPAELVFGGSVKKNLIRIMRDMDQMTEGPDEEVSALFEEGKKPYQFQLGGIHAGMNRERLLIADDTGLGKTIQTIGIMARAFQLDRARRAVLVVPSGLKYQWHEQIQEFIVDPPRPCLVMTPGSKKARREAYMRDWKVLIVNPELIWRDVDLIQRVMETVDLCALDEASCIRNPDTVTFKAMKKLFGKCRYKIALTATPVENKLADLKAIFDWVEPRTFMSSDHFDRRYCVWQKKTFSVYSKRFGKKVRVKKKEVKRYRNLGEVKAKIRPYYIRRRVQDVGLELPPLVVSWETLEMPKKQREVYDAVRDKVMDKIQGLRGVALTSPLSTLRQSCNSTELVVQDGKRPTSVKTQRLMELLETELYGQQVILFTDYERFAQMLHRDLISFGPALYTGPMNKDQRNRAINSFKSGRKRILIGTRALERGHNLQNASVVVNMDLPWNPAAIKQRLGRILRIGTKHETVRLINIITLRSVEERLMLGRIYKKRKTFETLFGEDELSRADPLEGMVGSRIGDLL